MCVQHGWNAALLAMHKTSHGRFMLFVCAVLCFLLDHSIHQGDIDFSFTRTSKELRSHEEIKCDREILISYSVLRQKSCSQNML